MLRRLHALVLFVALLRSPAFVGAQTAKFPPIVGLKTWTAEQVNDSLIKRFGPSQALNLHPCGANLKSLGFPRTASFIVNWDENQPSFFVTLFEGDTSQIQTNRIPAKTAALAPDWQAALKPFIDTSGKYLKGDFYTLVQLRPLVMAGKADLVKKLFQETTKKQRAAFEKFLSKHNRASDYDAALSILANDSSTKHRALAVAVLSNFLSDDKVWLQLAHALRDPSDNVSGLAANVLDQWSSGRKTPMDWTPAFEDLRFVLAGGNLGVLPAVLSLLNKTEVPPALAKRLLANNGMYVIGYAGATEAPQYARLGQAFLARASGKDYGADAGKWKGWVESL